MPTIVFTVLKLVPGDDMWGATCTFSKLETAKEYVATLCKGGSISRDGWEGTIPVFSGIQLMIEENCMDPTDWK